VSTVIGNITLKILSNFVYQSSHVIQKITYIGARKVMKEMTLPAKRKEKKTGTKIRRLLKMTKEYTKGG
jgi:hypothetical protein